MFFQVLVCRELQKGQKTNTAYLLFFISFKRLYYLITPSGSSLGHRAFDPRLFLSDGGLGVWRSWQGIGPCSGYNVGGIGHHCATPQ